MAYAHFLFTSFPEIICIWTIAIRKSQHFQFSITFCPSKFFAALNFANISLTFPNYSSSYFNRHFFNSDIIWNISLSVLVLIMLFMTKLIEIPTFRDHRLIGWLSCFIPFYIFLSYFQIFLLVSSNSLAIKLFHFVHLRLFLSNFAHIFINYLTNKYLILL